MTVFEDYMIFIANQLHTVPKLRFEIIGENCFANIYIREHYWRFNLKLYSFETIIVHIQRDVSLIILMEELGIKWRIYEIAAN